MVGGCTVASGYKGYWVAGHPAAVAAGTLEVAAESPTKTWWEMRWRSGWWFGTFYIFPFSWE